MVNFGWQLHIKRVFSREEEEMQKNRHLKSFLDQFVYVIGAMGVIVTLPQVAQIWVSRSAANISLITWLGFLGGAIFWAFYGLIHKARPILATNLILILLNLAVVVGIIIYS